VVNESDEAVIYLIYLSNIL